MRIEADKTRRAKFADNLIAATDGLWYEVKKRVGKDTFLCRRVETREFRTNDLGVAVPWSMVGVKR